MSAFALIDVQGFKHSSKFILKEVYIMTDTERFHAFIKSPFPFKQTNPNDRQEINWLTNNYHGIQWNRGNISLKSFLNLVKPSIEGKAILCKGDEKMKWIEEIFNGVIAHCENLEGLGCNLKLHAINRNDKNCLCPHHRGMNHCAVVNVIALKNWIINSNINIGI